MESAEWELYILRCGDGTLYTGIARDAEKRLAMLQIYLHRHTGGDRSRG